MGLRQELLDVPVSALTAREILTVPPATPVRQVVRKMVAAALGCAFVVDEAGKPQGKFTERQLIKLLASGQPFLDDPVEEHMTKFWACIAHHEPIANLVHKMQSHKLRFVCLVDDDGRAMALAGQRGLMEYLAEHFPRAVKVQLMDAKLYMDQREGA